MIGWDELTARRRRAPEFIPVPFSAPLWILYSSGTTGLPKPIVQSVGGILLEHLKSLRLQWDLGPGDRFLWFTTTGWMMWNFLIGGLLVGATVVLYDGSPGHPDLTTLWRVAERHRVTLFGVSAAYVTACRKAGITPGHDGRPVRAAHPRLHRLPVGRQRLRLARRTRRGTYRSCRSPAAPISARASSAARPRSRSGRARSPAAPSAPASSRSPPTARRCIDEVGELVITAPMPSMPVFFWGDDDGARLRDSYFDNYPGIWRHGDWIRITSRGSCVIEGRSDATLNRGGIRMGTAEFYRVVEALPEITDSLVIDTFSAAGEGDLLLFVVLTADADADAVAATVKTRIRHELTPRHVPGKFIPVASLPRTLNGKKCEVPVKRILAGTPPSQAISRDALADPDGFDAFLQLARGAVS